MTDQNPQPSEQEIALMVKRAGVTLPSEQSETCGAVVARLQAAAGRLRKDLR